MDKKIHKNSKYHNILTKGFLIKEYIINKKSTIKIAKYIDCGKTTIENYLIKYNIKRRNKAANWDNKNNPKFKHGKTLKIHYCLDCEKIIEYRSMRCQSCAVKFLCKIGVLCKQGKNSPNFGKTATKETKIRMSLSHGGTGISQTDIKCHCIDCGKEIYHSTWFRGGKRCKSCAVKEQHRNNIFDYRRAPNKPETLLFNLFKISLPKEYKFVGNNKIVIDTFNPDFINCNGQKKIIELFGCYWHKCQQCGFGNGKKVDNRKLKVYKKYGYKTLIIWEHELKQPEQVIAKIMEFNLKEKITCQTEIHP